LQNDTLASAKDLPPLNTLPLVEAAAAAIWDKKGFEVVALRVREIVQYTDYMVIASATSDRHAMAIADEVEDRIFKLYKQKPIGSEGRRQGRWVLVDFGDIVVHVFHRPVRDYYEIERLYADAPQVELNEPAWVKETSPESMIEQAGDYGDELWRTTDGNTEGGDWDDEGGETWQVEGEQEADEGDESADDDATSEDEADDDAPHDRG
jgi:ribosome-associated protein